MPATVDELDLALIDALQAAPRAPWSLVGKVLGTDAATARRRWHRLADSGNAWFAAYPFGREFCAGFIEISCEAGMAATAVESLARDPHAVTLSYVAGGCDVHAIVMTPDLPSFSRYIIDRVASLPGIQSTRSHLLTRMYREGSQWSFGSLDPEQRATLPRHERQDGPAAGRSWDELEQLIARELADDARLPLNELAVRTGTSVSTVRRKLTRLLKERRLILRCELRRSESSWPVSAVLWGRTDPTQVSSAAAHLARVRQTRMCGTLIAGQHNLVASVWLPSWLDLEVLEAKVAGDLPGVSIADRALVLRPAKVLGNILDTEGYRTGTVPLEIWKETAAKPIGHHT